MAEKGFLARLKGMLEGVREETYPRARNAVAEWALQTGGKGTSEAGKQFFHGQGNYALTKGLGSVLPPEIAANLSDTAYLGNEAVTGTLAKATGRPFFSDYGFRWADVGINRGGQDRAVKELRARMAVQNAMRESEAAGMKGKIPGPI